MTLIDGIFFMFLFFVGEFQVSSNCSHGTVLLHYNSYWSCNWDWNIEHIYRKQPDSPVVEGVSNAASAGILIYMSLVDMLAAEFKNSKLQSNLRLLAWANISVLLGAGCISLLAIWA